MLHSAEGGPGSVEVSSPASEVAREHTGPKQRDAPRNQARLQSKKEIKAGEKTQASYELIAPAVCTIPVLFSACRFSPECFNIRGKVLIMCSNMTAINRER